MKICTVSFESAWKDVAANLLQTEKDIEAIKAINGEVDTIMFPEMHMTGYVLDDEAHDFAEVSDGPLISAVSDLAQKYNVNIIGGFVEKGEADKIYNAAFVVNKKGELVTTYRKNHMFSQSAEPEIYTPGESLQVFDLDGVRCGIYICFDCRYPRLFESYKKEGVDLVFGIYNWVAGRNKNQIFEGIVQARASENQIFVAAVDCVGGDKNASYVGSHFIANPVAQNIEETVEEKYHFATIDLEEVKVLEKILPLVPSYKESYVISHE